MAGRLARTRHHLRRAASAVAVALFFAVIVFDIAFVWFEPTSDLAWAVWLAFLFGGNAALVGASVHLTGCLGPFRLFPPAG